MGSAAVAKMTKLTTDFMAAVATRPSRKAGSQTITAAYIKGALAKFLEIFKPKGLGFLSKTGYCRGLTHQVHIATFV